MAQKSKKKGKENKNQNSTRFPIVRGNVDYFIVVVTLILLCLGLIMLLSASAPTSISESGNSYSYFKRQIMAASAGLAFMFILSFINYKYYRKFKYFIYVFTIILLFLVEIMGMGSGGAKRWINLFGFNFQPSEVAKLSLIIFFAAHLVDLKEKGNIRNIFMGAGYSLILLAVPLFIIFHFQNHLSACIIIGAITLIQMIVGGIRISHLLCIGAVCSPFIYKFIGPKIGLGGSDDSFRGNRIQTWKDPFKDKTAAGWQIVNSLYAIGSGGLLGKGIGNSRQKYTYLPEAHNDFIFAILAEELGFVGCIVVIGLFIALIWRGIYIASKADDEFGSLIAIGIVAMIGLQALINVAVVTNSIPVTGMPLPFFSYGGTAILVDLAAVGVLLSIARQRKTDE